MTYGFAAGNKGDLWPHKPEAGMVTKWSFRTRSQKCYLATEYSLMLKTQAIRFKYVYVIVAICFQNLNEQEYYKTTGCLSPCNRNSYRLTDSQDRVSLEQEVIALCTSVKGNG